MPKSNVRLTILCDNSVARPLPVVGEHGFSCLVETPETTLLFDTGRGAGLLDNARALGKDLGHTDGIVLSHGHYDHGGGLLMALEHSGAQPVYAHPEIFSRRQSLAMAQIREIGLPFTRADAEQRGARFNFHREFVELAPGVHLSGEIPRTTTFEEGDARLVVPVAGEASHPDPLTDDLSLIVATPRGPILLLGCAHAGLINILTHLRDQHGIERWYAVVGGTHLGPVSETQFTSTIAALGQFEIERLCVSHCTGLQRAARLYSAFPGKVHFAAVGFELAVDEEQV